MPITNKAQRLSTRFARRVRISISSAMSFAASGELDEMTKLLAEHYDEIVAAIKQDLAEVPF